MNKLKVFSLFSGFGGDSFALKKAGIDHEVVGFSEIDKYAIQCYNQNHNLECDFNTSNGWRREKLIKNFGDITKINEKELPDFDLLTGGFPCQSFSVAGKGLGELDTRGTLFNDIIRIAEEKKPKYMLLENVKGLLSKRHKETFDKILSELERIGYYVHWKVLNSKDYGIPQNRERVWFVCFREMYEASCFQFPKEEELNLFLKDILEDEVEEKYYLKEEYAKKLLMPKTSYCIDANYAKGTNVKGYLEKKRRQIIQVNNPKHSNNRVYSQEGISPTLNTMNRGNRQPFIQIKNATKQGYLEAKQGDGISLEHPNSKTRRGRVQEQISPTLQCNDSKGVVTNNLTIRKLTPCECFRLMGFLDDNINLDGLSNSQRYKLAGNGWDINVVSKLFKEMLK